MTTAFAPRIDVEEVHLPPQTIAGLRERVAVHDIPAFFARAVQVAAASLAREGIEPAGPPIAMYSGELGDTFEVLVGFPITRDPQADELVRLRLPGGRAARAVHRGPYKTLPEVYERLGAWFAERHLQPPHRMWEEYVVGPDETGDAGCVTRVVYPLP